MKRVLMLAFHFPPHAGSSGIQRTLRFVRHLPEHGIDALAPLDDPQAIADILQRSLNQIASGTANRVAEPAIRQASRAWRSEVLAGMFDQLLCRK